MSASSSQYKVIEKKIMRMNVDRKNEPRVFPRFRNHNSKINSR